MEIQHPRLIKINGRVWHAAAQLTRRTLYVNCWGINHCKGRSRVIVLWAGSTGGEDERGREKSFSICLRVSGFLCCTCLWPYLCPALCNHNPPGASVHGILQARILEWVAISYSQGSCWPRDWTYISCTAGGFFFFFFTTKPRLRTISLIRRYFSPWKYLSSDECTGYNNSFQWDRKTRVF